MKKISLLFSLLLFSLMLHAQTEINTNWKNQINPIFQGLNKSRVPNAILLDYAMEFTNVPAYNGTLTDSTYVDANVMGNIYKTLFLGKVTTSTQYFPKLEDIATNWVTQRQNYNQTDKSTIVLAGMYYKYAQISPTALSTNKITVSNNKYYDKFIGSVWQNPYVTKEAIAFASPVNNYNKLSFGVVLPQNLLLSNSASTIQSIQVNFNDGAGYKTVTVNQKVYANYTQNGTYDWTFKTTLTNGTILYSRTKIKIDAPVMSNNSQNRTTNFENNVFISGPNSSSPLWANGAILRIDYAPSHGGQLTKPLIVAEGFDAGSILTPEVEGGDRTLNTFLNSNNSLPNSGNLRNLLLFDSSQQYDIVYIDWQNGTNSIQHNSAVLKNVLAWVNTNKQGSEPNVLLGQSMGGVISRYTLANMETSGETHDVRLFIAHDSPMQGANTPLSLQYFSRHAYDQYTSAPVLYGLVEVVIPTVLNFVELMSLGNLDIAFPSVSDALTLQDTPAAMQMNYHYVDYSSNPTMSVHNAWQQEFESAGYPSQSRNIAISNGNECAVNHGFDPRAKFISLHDTHNPGFWGDLVHLVVTPLAGIVTSDLELTFLGLLPGSSKYFFDFDLYANPAIGASTRQVYWGKIRYEKKLLWLVKISHTITERSKNAPNGYLPFDTYSGGYYDISATLEDYEGYLPSNTIVNPRYGFIPVVSALDIKRNNSNVNPTDYLKNYAGGTTPEPALTSGFDNFIVDFRPNSPINNAHISFQPRNGNWLANELSENPNLIDNCSAFCSNAQITGSTLLCTTGNYSVTNEATTSSWSISEGSSLVTMSVSGNQVTINQVNPSSSGYITLNANYSNSRCGSASVSKRIWVGRPDVQDQNIYGGYDNVPKNTQSTFSVTPVPGATQYNWTIYTNSNNCGCTTDSNGLTICPSGTVFPKFSSNNSTSFTTTSTSASVNWGNCVGTYTVNCVAKNACGTDGIYYKVVDVFSSTGGGGGSNPCEGELLVYPNPINRNGGSGDVSVNIVYPGDPCDDDINSLKTSSTNQNQITIYDFYGNKVYSNQYATDEFSLKGIDLKRGYYILNVFTSKGFSKKEILIVE